MSTRLPLDAVREGCSTGGRNMLLNPFFCTDSDDRSAVDRELQIPGFA